MKSHIFFSLELFIIPTFIKDLLQALQRNKLTMGLIENKLPKESFKQGAMIC